MTCRIVRVSLTFALPLCASLCCISAGQTPLRAAEPSQHTDDCDKLRRLILDLVETHGERYGQSSEHLRRLKLIQEGKNELAKLRESLAQLRRDVLLFDVKRLLVIKRHEITASHVYTYHYEGFRAGGGLYVFSPHDPQRPLKQLVASPTGQILDCDLSHDGKVALFSWRRKQDEGYHLWTVHVDGKNLKQLTDGPWHDYNACWLPDGDIAFLTTRHPQFAYCWHAPVGTLHRMKPDGSAVKKLSANYLNDFTPQVLDDGRIIYSRWEYVDRPAIPIQSLWTINPDGTRLAGYFGNRVLSPGTFMEARSIPGSSKIICTMTGHNGPTRGAIGVIDRRKGANAQAAIENITPEVPIQPVNRGNGNTGGTKQYSGPLPLDGERFLVSARGPVLVRTIRGDFQSVVLPAPKDGMQYFGAQPIRPRRRPPVIPSTLPEGAKPQATLFVQDVYQGLEQHVKRGELKTIRVIRELPKTVRIDPKYQAFGFQFPVISCGATYAAKDVLGEVAIEPDGSACFRVPSGVPVSFMVLDERGRAVQRMRSFSHLAAGEVQGCVGCHSHRSNLTPQSHVTIHTAAKPKDLMPPEWGAGGFDYSRIVQPVLDKHCVKCHNPVDGATLGGSKHLDLTGGKTDFFSVSYDVLARENQSPQGSPYVSWIPTYNGQEQNILAIEPKTWGSPKSKLAEVILSGDRDEGGKIPRRVWTRITEPELNPFLLAPLAKAAGGSGQCGKPVFADKNDPDYRAILETFKLVQAMLKKTPRMDMPGGRPAPDVCRDSQ